MRLKSIAIVFLSLIILCASGALANTGRPMLHLQWDYVNYSWPSPEAYELAINEGSYIQEHNVVGGIKLWKDRLHLAVPRMKNGVPATLASILAEPKDKSPAPLLEPFPSWEMQQIGDCSALQFVQNMEIDPKGRMWVINNGRIEIKTNHSRLLCPTRLMIFDLENNDELLLDYAFPESVVHPDSVHLNDLVLDHEDGGFAYITDNDGKHPGIVVFSLRRRSSWKVGHSSMLADPEACDFFVNSTKLHIESNIEGIALSPASTEGRGRTLYYSPLPSYQLFSLPTFVLKRTREKYPGVKLNITAYPRNPPRIIDAYVTSLGVKPSQSDGMTVSAAGVLYFGQLQRNAIGAWNTKTPPFGRNQRVLAEDPELLQWSASFVVDHAGRLWSTAKGQSVSRIGALDENAPNFRIVRTDIGSRGYQYYEDGSAPSLPEIQRESLIGKLGRNLGLAMRHLRRSVLLVPFLRV